MRPLLAAAVAAAALCAGATGCGTTSAQHPETAPAQAPREFFGVVPQGLLDDADLARMRQGHVGTIRLVVPWGVLVPSGGDADVDFSSIDPIVLDAADAGIKVVPTVYGTPTWVAEGLDGRDCDPDCGPYAPSSEAGLAAWSDFIGRLVERYGPGGELWSKHPSIKALPVRSWQIWNEQNSPTFYQPKVDPAAYAKLLGAASAAITERDPGAEVILGGMFGTPFNGRPPGESAWDYLRKLYAIDGARDSFDAVAAHPYAAHPAKIELQVERLHEEVARAGDDAGMWITEVGASSDEGPNPLERGPEGQAEQLREAFTFFLDQRRAYDIEGVTWYSWRDTADPSQCAWCPGSGLFEQDSLTPKPAWDAFVSFTGGS